MTHAGFRQRRSALVVFASMLAVVATAVSSSVSHAEGKLVVAEQFGIGYLPLHVIRDRGLIEKYGKESGLDITVEWKKLSGGAAINDALLAGAIDIGSGGVAPLLTLWDRTRGTLDVKAISAFGNAPLYLLTNKPNIKSLADFGPNDRIAVPSVKVSIQARILQIAAEKEFGPGQHEKLDNITVSLPHPDATKALIAGGSEITGHVSSPPFQYQALEQPGVRKLLSSYDVLGGPSTFNLVWTTSKFRTENPKTYAAFLAALKEAITIINADKNAAAETFIRVENSKLDKALIQKIVNDPEITYSLTPTNTHVFADFLYRTGALKNKAATWKDYFFDDLHTDAGS